MGLKLRERLLSGLLHVLHHFDRRTADPQELGTAKIERILVMSNTAIGDSVMSLPALRRLREAYPWAQIVWMVHPAYAGLFQGVREVDAIWPYAGRWSGWMRMVRQARAQRFDLVCILHSNEPQATPLAYLSGARWRFKLPNTSRFRFLLSNPAPVRDWDDFEHGVDQRMAVVELAIPPAPNFSNRPVTASSMPLLAPPVPLPPEFAARLGAHPVVGFQLGASTVSRRWPVSRFVALALRLLKAWPTVRIVVTGSPAEAHLAADLVAGVTAAGGDVSRVIVSAGALPLAALPALLQRMVFLVTPDTGVMHLAVAVKTPVLALFAVSDWRRSGPMSDLEQHRIIQKWRTCTPCLSKRCPHPEPMCMDLISVDEVATAAQQLWAAADLGANGTRAIDEAICTTADAALRDEACHGSAPDAPSHGCDAPHRYDAHHAHSPHHNDARHTQGGDHPAHCDSDHDSGSDSGGDSGGGGD